MQTSSVQIMLDKVNTDEALATVPVRADAVRLAHGTALVPGSSQLVGPATALATAAVATAL
jgi:hypothetical protein